MVAFIRVDEKPHHDSPSLPISLARASHTSRPFLCRRGDYRAGGESESINSVSKPYPPAPLGSELRPDAQGFLTATRKGIAEDMAQDLSDGEQQILTATQGQTSASVFGATIKTAVWKSKPSWAVIAGNDQAIPPQLEKDEAATIKATSITVPANHLAVLSHPREVSELIQQAAAKAK
jgi:hypothetical protein